MSIEVETRIEKDYLFFRFCGEYSIHEATRVFKFIIDTAVENIKSRILVDVFNLRGYITVIERFQMSEFLAMYAQENALGKIYKMAFAGNEPLVDRGRFGETVAVNRGLRTKVFTDLDEALAWVKV